MEDLKTEVVVKTFDELSAAEVYNILRLRSEVFVVEQECPYPDADGNDFDAVHLYISVEDEIAAYCRVLKPGVVFPSVAIGRVVTRKKYRGFGHARRLMGCAFAYVKNEMNEKKIMISAQAYLKRFYGSLGFDVVSEDYLEDGIPHCDMLYCAHCE